MRTRIVRYFASGGKFARCSSSSISVPEASPTCHDSTSSRSTAAAVRRFSYVNRRSLSASWKRSRRMRKLSVVRSPSVANHASASSSPWNFRIARSSGTSSAALTPHLPFSLFDCTRRRVDAGHSSGFQSISCIQRFSPCIVVGIADHEFRQTSPIPEPIDALAFPPFVPGCLGGPACPFRRERRAARQVQARARHLQRARHLGFADNPQSVPGSRHRRRGVPHHSQARRRAEAVGERTQGREEAVRRFRRRVLGMRQHLRVPRRRPGRR